MVDYNQDDLLKNIVMKQIDSIQVPKGLKEEIWKNVRPIEKTKKKRKNFIPIFAFAACFVILIALGMSFHSYHSKSSSGQAPFILWDPHPPIKPEKVGSILSNSEVQLNNSSGIVTTASAFDGKKNIKFRLMVNGAPSKKEATKLFNNIIKTVKANANNKDLWSYYNGSFDIKNYTTGVIYTATKKAGKSMTIEKK